MVNQALPGRDRVPEWLFAAGLVLLACILGLSAFVQPSIGSGAGLAIAPLADARGRPAGISEDRQSMLLPGGVEDVAVRLDFTLPPAVPGTRWVIWMSRAPVDAVQVGGAGWQSGTRHFYAPADSEGPLAIGYSFPLPASWSGAQSAELHVRSAMRGTLHPRLMTEADAAAVERRGVVVTAMVYASLFTLALMALALFSAARDRMFLGFFGYASITLLMLAAINGHLYAIDGLAWIARWQALGLIALTLLFCAASTQMLLQYAGSRARHAEAVRALDGFGVVLVVLAATCLLGLPALLPWLRSIAILCWVVTAAVNLAVVADAARHRVSMAWPMMMVLVLISIASLLWESVLRGDPLDLSWASYAYQVSLVVSEAILAVGLVSRISEYRDQRDRERLARTDSERRMRREAARSDLNAALQIQLRACAETDVEWAAFRLMLDHLLPHVRAETASVIARGYHGQDVLVTLPATRARVVETALAPRELALKRQAANGIPLQQPVSVHEGTSRVAMEVLVPLQIRAPAWGMLVLERAGGDGFTTDELALAGECARLTLTHIDQALAAINLRRSAELDALTGIFNRRTVDQWLARCFGEAQRDGLPISVLFVDMDHFKSINDRHGHAAGDQCLRDVAACLRTTVGEGDLIGRYGGEEFIAVLPGRGGAAARAVGEQLRIAIERLRIRHEELELQVTVSVGVATRLNHETSAADTIDRADKALYAAKRGGRNCVHVAPAVFS